MKTIKQKTIGKPVNISGIGLHKGENITANLYPAECDTGVVFKRTDIPGTPVIQGNYKVFQI